MLIFERGKYASQVVSIQARAVFSPKSRSGRQQEELGGVVQAGDEAASAERRASGLLLSGGVDSGLAAGTHEFVWQLMADIHGRLRFGVRG